MLKAKVAIVLSAALVLAVGAMVAVALAPANATYKGAGNCKMCHSGPVTKESPAIVKAYDKSAHSKAFSDDSKAIVGGFGPDCPIKKEQVKYVLGVGVREQGYLDANFQVLPAEWDVVAKKFDPATITDGSKQCVGCHVTGYDPAAKTWVQAGIGCEMCHGPGSEHNGVKEKITNPKTLDPDKKAMICGQCHSKGTDTTKTYAFPVKFRPGDDLAKSFIDAKPTTPGRNQQYSELITSKHWASMKMTCVQCHDPHGPVGTNPSQLKKPINDTCLGCHSDKQMDKHAAGAAAGSTCATCHMPGGAHTFKKPGG